MTEGTVGELELERARTDNRAALLATCVGAAITVALMFFVSWAGGRTAAPLLLLAAAVTVCSGLAWRLTQILRAIVDRDIRDEERKRREARGERPRASLFGEDSEFSIEIPPRERLEIFVNLHQRVVVGVALVVLGFFYVYLLGAASGLLGVDPKRAAPLGICYFVMAFLALVVGKFVSAAFDASEERGLWAIAILFRALMALLVLSGVLVLPAAYAVKWTEPIAAWTTLVVLGVFLVEMAVNWLLSFFHPHAKDKGIRLPYDSAILEVPFASMHPVESVLRSVERQFGVNLRDTWAVAFLRAAILPLILGQLAALWLLTSLSVVQPDEQGILERFGEPLSTKALDPGLHVKMPWPVDHVRRFRTRHVSVLTIGFEEKLAGSHYLWSKRHVRKEYKLMLGDGRELMSFEVEIYYRIADVYAHAYKNADPVGALRAIAYRVLTDEMIGRNLDRILSAERVQFANALYQRISSAAKNPLVGPLGIEILAVVLKGMHPPVDIAPAYQDVVSAQVEKVTKMRRAQEYAAKTLPQAAAEANTKLSQAGGFRADRIGRARGEAARFVSALKAYGESKQLYTFRRYVEALENVLRGARHILIDHTTQQGADYWLDLRKQKREER